MAAHLKAETAHLIAGCLGVVALCSASVTVGAPPVRRPLPVAVPPAPARHLDLTLSVQAVTSAAAQRTSATPDGTSAAADRISGWGSHRAMQDDDDDKLAALRLLQQDRETLMSRTEAFAKRFHREGLPVARLWEGHAAVLSLGLNARGKPGLWLIQKVP